MASRLLSALRHLVATADPTTPTPVAGMEYYNSTLNVSKIYNGSAWIYKNEFALPFQIGGALTVGVTGRKQRIKNRSGSPWVIIGANLYLNTAPVGSSATLQVNKNGASAFTISVATTVNESNTPSATNIVVNDGDYLDVDVTAIGSTTAGSDATLTLCFAS